MIRRIFLILLILFVSMTGYSQFFVSGKVLSLPGRRPISFVNIGIVNSSVGTISDEDGSFLLKIPNYYKNDTVIFSALGYGNIKIPVAGLSEKANFMIYLKESPTNLKTVTIKGDSWKRKVYRIGNRSARGSIMVADTVTAGSAIALLIKNDPPGRKSHFEYPMYAERAQLLIFNNTFPEFKVRTRLYDVDESTGLPGKDLLNESVITRSEIDSGILKIDLSKYNIEINGDFFLVFEWILDKNDRRFLFQQFEGYRKQNPDKVSVDYSYIDGKKFHYLNYLGNFYAGPSFGISVSKKSVNNNVCYYRLNSFGEWKRSPSILTADIILSDTPSWSNKGRSPADTVYDGTMEELLSYYSIEPMGPDFNYTQDLKIQDSVDQSFIQRDRDPISIAVHRINNQFNFFANNPSYYPYRLVMNFSGIINLMPIINSQSFILKTGQNRLLTFNVADPSIPNFHYDLSVKEIIGDTTVTADTNYPYLFPIRDPKKARKENLREYYYGDVFDLNDNDTIYAMRKGIVTALPGRGIQTDRVYADRTLEVYHADGTIMTYKNIDPQNLFINAGEFVYPGQPMGIINSGNDLEVELFQINSNGRLKRIVIYYYSGESRNYLLTEFRKDFITNSPDSIVMKEMTEREIRMYIRNSLFR
jgi:hypothetical protein